MCLKRSAKRNVEKRVSHVDIWSNGCSTLFPSSQAFLLLITLLVMTFVESTTGLRNVANVFGRLTLSHRAYNQGVRLRKMLQIEISSSLSDFPKFNYPTTCG